MEASTNELRAPLLQKRGGRTGGAIEQSSEADASKGDGGLLAAGSPLSSILLLCSAAIGTGVLALPYGVSRVGVIPAVLVFALAALAAYTSNAILFMCVRETRLGSYGELMTGILGKNGAMVLDAFVCIEGLGAVATYLVFIMDYVPQVCALGGEDLWCTNRYKVVAAAGMIIWPLSCMQGLSALRYISTCSIVTIIFTSGVVIMKAPACFAQTGGSFLPAVTEVNVGMIGGFQALSMACFAFMTHTNTPEIALQMVGPTKGRIRRVVATQTSVLWFVYLCIAICGFMSFMEKTEQDFLTNYELRDKCIVLCRIMLSTTLVFACPINICPSIQALFNILQHTQSNNGQSRTTLYDNTVWRVTVTTLCFLLSLVVALKSPHVADLISIICAFFTSPLMFTFPAMMYRGILKRRDQVVPTALHTLTISLWVAEILRLLS